MSELPAEPSVEPSSPGVEEVESPSERPAQPPWLKWLSRAAGLGIDLLAISLVLWLRLLVWPRGLPEDTLAQLPDADSPLWAWVGSGDFMLFGPDAGQWAESAQNWLSGARLDPHRMPIYTALTAWLSPGGEVIVGGHLVNHLAGLLTAVLVYVAGALSSGRGVGLGAALWVAALPALISSQMVYGVDPSFALMFMLAVTATVATARWWFLFPLAGIASGLLAGTHYLGLAFPVVFALFAATTEGRWWAKLLACVGTLAIAAGVLHWLLSVFPGFGIGDIVGTYQEGISNPTGGADHVTEPLRERLITAPRLAVQRGLMPLLQTDLPWTLLVVLMWVGVVGFQLPGRQDKPWDWRMGLGLLILCGPLMLLEATRAPERYRDFLRPVVILLVMRGVGGLGAAAEWGIGRKLWPLRWPAIPRGWLPVLLCGGVGWFGLNGLMGHWPGPQAGAAPRGTHQPHGQHSQGGPGAYEQAVGQAVKRLFPEAPNLMVTRQVVAFHSGMDACPANPCGNRAGTLHSCRVKVDMQCKGEVIPVVVEIVDGQVTPDALNGVFDEWVWQSFEPIETLADPESGSKSLIYALPREEIRPAQTQGF